MYQKFLATCKSHLQTLNEFRARWPSEAVFSEMTGFIRQIVQGNNTVAGVFQSLRSGVF